MKAGRTPRQINVRERLFRDTAWIYGLFESGYLIFVLITGRIGFGNDSHAYWLAWRGPMYTTAPGTVNAYLYSPLFAQLIWPLAQLPWPLFGIVVSLVDALVLAWLLKPLGWKWAVAFWLAGLPEIVGGNISALIAVAAVLGFRRPGTWALSALTKITPTLGPFWFLVRREWRALAITILATVAVAIPSVVAAPHLWLEWFDFLRSHLSESTHPTGMPFLGPMTLRVPIGLALVAWAALKNRRWYLPIGMYLCYPVLWVGAFTLLASIPRIRLDQGQTALPQFPWDQAERAVRMIRDRLARLPLPGRRASTDR